MNRQIRRGRNKALVKIMVILMAVFMLMGSIPQPALASGTQFPISENVTNGMTVSDQERLENPIPGLESNSEDNKVAEEQNLEAPALTADAINNIIGQSINITFSDKGDWSIAISSILVDGIELDPEQYAVSKEKITINAEVFTAVGDYQVLVVAQGYTDTGVTQPMEELNQANINTSTSLMGIMGDSLAPPDIIADTSQNLVNKAIELTFDDDATWRSAITGISLDAVDLTTEQYVVTEGKITLSQELFTVTKDYAISIKATGYTDVLVTQAIQNPLIIITGDAVTTHTEFTENELKSMEQVRARYSTVNTWPTKSWYVTEGVKLADLLAIAGIKDDAKSIVFNSSDGFKARFTADEMLKDKRYYYPGLKENHEYFGYILGSTDGAVEVPALIALLDSDTDDFSNLSARETPKIVFGQRALGEQTNSVFAKYTKTIEVSATDPGKWENPIAKIDGEIVTGGTIPAGTLVELYTSNMDGDSIHYTTDGTDPTYESPMYNWIKKRWWSSRSDELATINHPIAVDRTMTLKATSIGFGKNNSDMVTFNFRVTDAYPPVLVRDTTDVVINQEIEITFPDDQQWVDAITQISVNDLPLTPDKYTIASNKITFMPGVFTEDGDYSIIISATDFRDASLIQKIVDENAAAPILTADTSNNAIRQAIDLTFTANAEWEGSVTQVSVDGIALADEKYTVGSGKITIAANVLNEAKEYHIVVQAIGYNDVTVTQTMLKIPPVLSPDTTDFVGSQPIELTFAEDADWQAAVSKVLVGDTELTTDQYEIGAGTITIVAGVLHEVRDYIVVVQATGYVDTNVTQAIWPDGTVPPVLSPDTTDNAFDQEIVLTFVDDEDWRSAITKVMAGDTQLTGEQYTLGLGTISILDNVLAVGDYTIVVYATGYKNAVVAQSVVAYPPIISPQTVNNGVNHRIEITYSSNTSYRNAIKGVLIDGIPLPSDKYGASLNGKIIIYADVLNEVKDYNIIVQAQGYLDASVIQPIKTAAPALTKDGTNANVGQPIDITFADDPAWRAAVTGVTVDGISLEAEKYTWEAGKLIFIPGVFTEYRSSWSNPYIIVVSATGYADSSVEQGINRGTVKLTADTTNNVLGQPIEITFVDDPYWRSVITDVQVKSVSISADKYAFSEGKLTIQPEVFQLGLNGITIKADHYNNASISQNILQAIAVIDVSITEDNQTLEVDQTVQLNAVIDPENASNKNISWSSSDDAVATVDDNGLVTAVAKGEAIITVTTEDGKFTDSIMVTVESDEPEPVAVTGVSITEGNQTLEIDQTVQLNAVVVPEDATNTNVTWSSSDENIATVDADGLVTAVAEGEAIITVTTEDGNKIDTVTVTVTAGAVDIPLKVVVKENGVETRTVDYNLGEWEGLERQYYSARDSMPAYRLGAAEGVFLEDILNDAEINIENIDGFKFNTTDHQSMSLSKGDLLGAEHYYYPNIFSDNKEEGAQIVKPMLALKSYVGSRNNSTLPSWESIDDKNTIRLFVGQKNVEDINYGLFAKWISEIEIEVTEPAQPVDVTDVSITEDNQTLEVDRTVQLNAVVVPEDATNKNVTWSSSDENIATVDATGLVTALVEGTATITVTTEDENKTDSITITVVEGSGGPTMDILYQGTVNLEAGKTFTVTAYDSEEEYTVNENTPLGALHKAAIAGGFSFEVTDNRWSNDQVLLLDNVGDYEYNNPGKWYAYVNDVFKDGYKNTPDGLNVIELKDEDKVEFYYANDIENKNDLDEVKAEAIAAVLAVVDSEATPPTDWTLQLSGAKNENVTKAYFEQGLACSSSGHQVSWTDGDGNIWGGVPLWLLVAMVDDDPDVGDEHINFNEEIAAEGYDIKVIAGDGLFTTLDSAAIARNDAYIVANTLNGEPLPLKTDSGKDCWPLYLKGSALLGGQQVGNIVRIELSGLPEDDPVIPELHIVKYAEDGTTVLNETTIDYVFMEENFEVLGDGVTEYKFQGITFDPNDLWDEEETGKGGFKINNAVRGTRLQDLCDLVGGMGAGTEIVLAAYDGWETRLPYSSIHPDPSVYARQGDAILAWYADGQYVPDYRDGMRLFFTPADTIYSQVDMRESLPEPYWHYYGASGIMYPSCAGLSAKYITTIKVYSVPQGDWTLELDGQDMGGISADVSKTYFESALTCTMGANHKASYTDSKNRVWEGMPLWLLAGFVDDADQHSNNAFNETLAEAGYQLVLTAEDGYSVTIDSQNIINNNDYIVANTLDGLPIPETDDNWPLRLVGPGVSGSDSIGNIVSIKLTESSLLLTPPALTADTVENRVGQAIDITFTDDAAWRAAITGITVDGLNVADTKYAIVDGKITIAENVFTEAKNYAVVVKAIGYEDAIVTQAINTDAAIYIVQPVEDSAYTIGATPVGIKTMTVNAGISGFNYFTINIEAVASNSGLETAVFTHLRNGSQVQINSTRADFDQVGTAQAGFNVKAGDIVRVYIVDELTNADDHNPVIMQ